MKNVKLMMVIMLGAFVTLLHAQPQGARKGNRKDGHHGNMDSLAKKYNLSSQQQTDLKRGFKYLKSEKVKPTNKEEKRTIGKLQREKRDSIIKVVFTPTQYAQFQKDEMDRKAMKKEQSAEVKSTKIADSLAMKYSLDAVKKLQVKNAYLTFFTEIQKVKEANKASGEEGKNKEGHKAAKTNLDTKMKGILSIDNYNAWKTEAKAKHKGK